MMPRQCPGCKEPIPLRDRDKPQCPLCGCDFYEFVFKRLAINFDWMMKKGLAIVVGLLVALQFFPPLGPVFVAVIFVFHTIVTRLRLVWEARRLMGVKRRVFIRWIPRMCFLVLGLPGYALSGTPVFGPLFGILTYALLTMIVHKYVRFCLQSERERRPLASWESLILVALAIIACLGVTVLLCLGMGIRFLLTWLGLLG